MKLSELNAVVTGGASGLGEATVVRIVKSGGKVTIFDLNTERAQKMIEDLGEESVFYVETDVTDVQQVEENMAKVQERFGSINAVINCAGVGTPGRVVSKKGAMPLEQFEQVIRINLIGTFNVTRVAAAQMQHNTPNEEGERGVIINTASIAAYEGQIGQAAYSASKGGVVSMTLPIARELAKDGIRVMAIAPGLMETPMIEGLPESAIAVVTDAVPFPKRLGKPAEFAQLVASIMENQMLNGEVIRLDGAVRMQPR